MSAWSRTAEVAKPGVIFDMDGILIDSEPLQMKVFGVMMGKRGIHIPFKEFITYVGMRASDNFRDIIAKYGLRTTPETLVREKDRLYRRIISGPIKPIPGVGSLLKTLERRGVPLALVSGSSRRDVDLVLKNLGFKKYFRIIVAGGDVKRGKPHPEGFLAAARMMKMKPARIFVLEDSGPGVEAGRRGGFRVLAVPTRFTRTQDFSGADRIFRNFKAVRRYLKTKLA